MERLLTLVRQLMRHNAAFFLPFALFLIVGAALLLGLATGDMVFFFSDHRSYWGDWFFRYATVLGEGGGFVAGLVLLLFIRFRYAVVLPVLGGAVSVLTQSAKKLFAHPRPAAFFREQHIFDQFVPVDGVVLHGGQNGFPSGHTMAAFALYTFLAFCLASRYRRSGWFFFLMALAVGISRVYLGQHFFKDVYLGAVLGVVLAMGMYLWAEGMDGGRRPWLDRSLTLPPRALQANRNR